MLNEVKSADIRKRLIGAANKGNLEAKIGFEIGRRRDTIEGLERQIVKEGEEIEYLLALDPIELEKEQKNGGE